jgi:glucose-1-phosphate cytidylyltransferase
MKMVLFCGKLRTRLREHSDTIPKPLVNIGYRPIVWHLMRYCTMAIPSSSSVSVIAAT